TPSEPWLSMHARQSCRDKARRAAGAGILLPLMFPVLSWRITGVLVSVWFGTGRGAWVVITGAESTSDLDRARRKEEFPFPSRGCALSQSTAWYRAPAISPPVSITTAAT